MVGKMVDETPPEGTEYQVKYIIAIGISFLIGVISGALLRAELLTIPDCIQAYSAIALTYFAFIQVAARSPIVFAWAEDWRDLIIENASDYPIFNIVLEYEDIQQAFGVISSKIKIIYSKKNQKIGLHKDFQRFAIILVTIQFRTGGPNGLIHRRKNRILLREPGSPF